MVRVNNIISDPRPVSPVYDGSLGEYTFYKWTTLSPDQPFLIDGENNITLSSGAALHKSIQVAERLRSLGLKVGDIVSVFGKNSLNINVASYGTILMGAVLAPTDDALNKDDLGRVLRMLSPKAIFCDFEKFVTLQRVIPNLEYIPLVIILDSQINHSNFYNIHQFFNDEIDVEQFKPGVCKNPKEDTSLILCTSGTTGQTKGAEHTHYGVLHQIRVWQLYKNVPSCFLNVALFFWVSHVTLLLCSPIIGITRIIISTFQPELCFKAIQNYKPKMTNITPIMMKTLSSDPCVTKYDVSSLKRIVLGGNAVRKADVDFIKANWPNKDVEWNQGLGGTELAGVAFLFSTPDHVLSCGTALPGNEVKIADIKTNEALGPYERGEICHKSPSLMKCYVGDAEATRTAVDRQGWYHSGDMGYYDEEEHFYNVGRIKEMFWSRNKYISPADLEAVIGILPGIKDVGITGVPNGGDDFLPIALVVKTKESASSSEVIKKIVEASIPEELDGVYFVDSLPRTSTEKLKRVELQKLAVKLHNVK